MATGRTFTAASASAAPSTGLTNASLYVGDLAPDVTDSVLYDTFNAVGMVESVKVCRDSNTRRSLGYAYVNFRYANDADIALQTLNFQPIHGKPCRIMWSQRDPSLRKSGTGNIFINGLDPKIDNKTLYDTFSTIGNILSCKVAQKDGESLGYGFVHYESEDAARDAIEQVDGKMIAGHSVSVMAFKSKKERQAGQASKYTNIYVKNLPEDITQEKFEELFAKWGKITSLKLSEAPPETKSGKKLTRYGFINYETNGEAVKAIEQMNGYELGKNKLYVGRHQKKAERQRDLRRQYETAKQERRRQYQNVNLYVKNLADDTTDEKLAQDFASFGTITSAKVMMDRTTGKSRGFGFVCFSTPEEATVAVAQMRGRMVNGKPLYVSLAQPKDERRSKLEAEHQNRGPFGQGGAQQMFRQGQMFYSNPAMAPPVQVFPQQMNMQGPWVNQSQMMHGQVPLRPAYTFVPSMQVNQQGGQGGQNRRNRGGRQQGNKQGAQGGHQGQPQQGGYYAVPFPQQSTMQSRPQNLTVAPLDPSVLAAATQEEKRQLIGMRLFPMVRNQVQPAMADKAGKITGMLLDLDDHDLLQLLESTEALDENIKEAIKALEEPDEESDENYEE